MINKASIDRGFGRCIVNHSYKVPLKRYVNRTMDRVVGTTLSANKAGRHRVLGIDGLAEVGQQIAPGAQRTAAHTCGISCAHMHASAVKLSHRCKVNMLNVKSAGSWAVPVHSRRRCVRCRGRVCVQADAEQRAGRCRRGRPPR